MKISRTLTLILTASAIHAAAGLAAAQCGTQTIQPTTLTTEDHFGEVIAVKGSVMVVGAPGDSNAEGASAGAAYVHTKNGAGLWSNSPQMLLPNDLSANSAFGQSVAIDTYIAVGANTGPFSGSIGVGAVYVYAPAGGGTWAFQKKLVSPDAAAGDGFGSAVAMMGDWLAVSAFCNDINGFTNNGSVYLYKRSGTDWLLQSTLAILNDHGGQLGVSLSMNNGYLAIGTNADVGAVGAAGTVYVYKLTGNLWGFQDYLASPSPQDNGRFGSSVSVHGTTLAVGAYMSDLPSSPVNPEGAVYMYNLVSGHFALSQTLTSGTGWNGHKVAINGNTMVATDLSWFGIYVNHLFRRTNGVWSYVHDWTQSHTNNGYTQADVAVSDTEIFVGMGSIDTANTDNSGQVKVIPIQIQFAPDDFVDREEMPLGSVSGCSTLAHRDGSAQCGNSYDSPDVWYQFTPASNTRLIIDTAGSNYDTVLSIHPGFGGNHHNALFCNDDAPGLRTSRIVYQPTPGSPIAMRIAGYNGATGAFTLNVQEVCAADFNVDGTVDFFDYLDFVDAFSSSDLTADFNTDTVLDFFDYLDFVDAFSSGC